MNKPKTITVTNKIVSKLNRAIESAMEFEALTGKQMNITSIVGEVLACKKYKMNLVVDDINSGFDAIDKDDKLVQIKTRRDKGNPSALTGRLLDKEFEVPFDYALLVLLDLDYSIKEIFRIDKSAIKNHFARINAHRISKGKTKRKTMSISQFKNLAGKASRK